MLKFYTFVVSVSLFLSANSQIISQFNWNSGSPLTAQVGPNATSISSSATISAGGRGGTNGLNAGLPKMNIDLVIPGSPTFDVSGIDLSIDYQRDESQIELVSRGSSFLLNASGGQLSVSYRVEDGAGGFVTISSGNVYAIPNDDTYRTYRFYYIPSTGVGNLLVDNVSVWTNDGVDNRSLYWTTSDNVVIAAQGDGSGSNKAFLDNFIVGAVTAAPLPVELSYFKVFKQVNSVRLQWETSSEINNDFFTLEKSYDAVEWEAFDEIAGKGNSSVVNQYVAYDYEVNFNKTTYYRLKQTDFNGDFSYAEIQVLKASKQERSISVYPNPAVGQFAISTEKAAYVRIYNLSGGLELEISNYYSNNEINVDNLPRGNYLVQIISDGQSTTEKLMLK
jgi:hypothetical protein